MKRLLIGLLTAGTLLAVAMPSFAATKEEEREKIQAVVETFRTSLINKDPVTFMTLFLKPDIPWIGVMTDQTLARQNAAGPDTNTRKVAKLFTGDNPNDFIKWISENKSPIEETFDNVRIDTDGDVAQVWFDYTFKDAGYKQNWGKEAWHLVRTEKGWKISSVIWSSELNPTPPPK
jgi:hypothetical protein